MEILLLEENKSFLELLSFELQLIVLFIKKKKNTTNPHYCNTECLFLQMPASFPSVPLNGLGHLLWWGIKLSSDIPQWVTNIFFLHPRLETATAFLHVTLRWPTWLFVYWSYSIVKSGPLPFVCFPPMWEYRKGKGRKFAAVFGWHSLPNSFVQTKVCCPLLDLLLNHPVKWFKLSNLVLF